ncbi:MULTISPECIES: imelysin family protein [Thalassospira]|uniref:Peptidase n=3 Tax=Thalassospira TaxID=168934 RepID=A0A853KWA5_9PROT|nr:MULTISPECIES: imelysin family protein [Thalassospira]MBO6802556.1 peptidase [Thalassospira sp.]MBO6819928.1 peptidase [Thalassospira sp.]MBO6889142.1 peptidase [Thalassospira sp.]NJB74530.1 putative iron-regulated protein [Thalassospira tepidiphila]OAZ08131.1 peptidase [Thalassospira tepidiphila MCCC 1A03514]
MKIAKILGTAALVTTLGAQAYAAPAAKDVLTTYADIAHAGYEDSLITAKELQAAIDELVANPSASTFDAAKSAWLASRAPYQQTEVYRFGNAIVDDWEGKVNAWPLDEGLIDYVETGLYGEESEENPAYTANVIANPTLTISGETIDASTIDAALLESLHEIDDVEANVATGYHAIEFLLWGQDLNGTDAGAGERKWTDYASGDACTNGNCDRRGEYLQAAVDLMVSDLEWMTAQWAEGGEARETVLEGDGVPGLTAIVTGMGSLSYGELGGERTKLGLLLHDPEEEHDCFSDNTHNSHFYDALGIQNVYLGRYTRVDGSVVEGSSLSDLVAANDAALDTELRAKLAASVVAGKVMVTRAQGGEAFDQLIAMGNEDGNAVVQAFVDALVDQTKSIEQIIAAVGIDGIEFEGSDSLDNPAAVN